MKMWMNEYDVDDAVRVFGTDRTPLGEATRALHALVEATNRNSDGWPYYMQPARAGARLIAIVSRALDSYHHNGKRQLPEVTQKELSAALRVVKAFRTRRDWAFALTDAERAAEAATAARKATAEREARVTGLANRFVPVLDEWLGSKLAGVRSDGPLFRVAELQDLATSLADLATH